MQKFDYRPRRVPPSRVTKIISHRVFPKTKEKKLIGNLRQLSSYIPRYLNFFWDTKEKIAEYLQGRPKDIWGAKLHVRLLYTEFFKSIISSVKVGLRLLSPKMIKNSFLFFLPKLNTFFAVLRSTFWESFIKINYVILFCILPVLMYKIF